jgi:hypothetical protein
MKTFYSLLLTMAMVGGIGCGKPAKVVKLADDKMLNQRCEKLHVGCEVYWTHEFGWRAYAHTISADDWWFTGDADRSKAVDKLYQSLGGSPTDPGDPLPQTIYDPSKP